MHFKESPWGSSAARQRQRSSRSTLAPRLGHGLAFLHAQDELNDLAPPGRRGEVSASFVCCVYAVVGGAVVGVGLVGERTGLTTAVDIVGGVLAASAVATAGWQGHLRGARTS